MPEIVADVRIRPWVTMQSRPIHAGRAAPIANGPQCPRKPFMLDNFCYTYQLASLSILIRSHCTSLPLFCSIPRSSLPSFRTRKLISSSDGVPWLYVICPVQSGFTISYAGLAESYGWAAGLYFPPASGGPAEIGSRGNQTTRALEPTRVPPRN